MRKVKIIKIDDREITLRELRVKDILELFSGTDESSIMSVISAAIPKCSDLTLDDLTEMAPSEIKLLYEAFKEVNEVFFETAEDVGLGKAITELKVSIAKSFEEALAGSFSPGISQPSTTAMPSS